MTGATTLIPAGHTTTIAVDSVSIITLFCSFDDAVATWTSSRATADRDARREIPLCRARGDIPLVLEIGIDALTFSRRELLCVRDDFEDIAVE